MNSFYILKFNTRNVYSAFPLILPTLNSEVEFVYAASVIFLPAV